jgi:hypothetical protein
VLQGGVHVPRRLSASGSNDPVADPSTLAGEALESSPADQISYSESSLHDLFNQQVRDMLDRTDLGEEQKQAILIGMSCPCCGGAAMSSTAKLRR